MKKIDPVCRYACGARILFLAFAFLFFACDKDDSESNDESAIEPASSSNVEGDDPNTTEESNEGNELEASGEESEDSGDQDQEVAEEEEGGDSENPVSEEQEETENEGDLYLADITPFSEVEAVDYLKATCSGCHQLGAPYASFWTLKDNFAKDNFSTDLMAPTVFQVLYQSTLMEPSAEGPKPMPPSAEAANVENNKRVLAWILKELPLVAQSANERYQNNLKLDEAIVLVHKCEQPMTLRQYMNTLISDTLGRIPTPAELDLFKDDLDNVVTLDHKNQLMTKLNDDITWNVEFINNGLKTFATKFSGADAISSEANTMLADADVVSTLKNEFYELLKLQFKSIDFKSIVLSDHVMVNEHTAGFYNCPAPPSGQWAACKMPNPRNSFFASLGFLSSKPSSFLQVNNNYGRVARMHYALKGTVFQAATDGPTGDVVAPLPDCFKTDDYRGEMSGDNIAPFGAAKIPSTGNICQSCHISRLLASGSLLFRPYYKHGQVMVDTDFFNPSLFGEGFEADVAAATSESYVNQQAGSDFFEPVSNNFLMKLVKIDSSTEQACIPSGNPDGSDLLVNNLGELANYWMGSDGIELAEGLARHFPRALSNVDATSDEIVSKVKEAYVSGNGLLMPMIEAYLKSETYSCQKSLD